jgi:hypothetical protein
MTKTVIIILLTACLYILYTPPVNVDKPVAAHYTITN